MLPSEKILRTAHPPFAQQTDVGFAHSRRPGKRTTPRKEASQILNGCGGQAPSGHVSVVKNIHSEHPSTDNALQRCIDYMSRPAYYLRMRTLRKKIAHRPPTLCTANGRRFRTFSEARQKNDATKRG